MKTNMFYTGATVITNGTNDTMGNGAYSSVYAYDNSSYMRTP